MSHLSLIMWTSKLLASAYCAGSDDEAVPALEDTYIDYLLLHARTPL